MKPPVSKIPRVDFTGGFDPALLKQGWGIGGYNVKRQNMYTAPQYKSERDIHMGIDIWAPAGEPVYAPLEGKVRYTHNHDQPGNYGGTIVLIHQAAGETTFALYGHLSIYSLDYSQPGKTVMAGDVVGWLGDETENGQWHPHLHYQLSRIDPEEADMPGVVSAINREQAKAIYPDPEKVIGHLV